MGTVRCVNQCVVYVFVNGVCQYYIFSELSEMAGSLCLWECVVTVMSVLMIGQVTAVPQKRTCKTYRDKLTSLPDLTHKTMYRERRGHDLHITDVTFTPQDRSFYWCELTLHDTDTSKTYRRFGHNSTHWWVKDGCGGTFKVTECEGDAVTGEESTKTDTSKVPSWLDGLYKKWPRVGFRFPTSDVMWDFLDRATWVDAKAQLGFYRKTRKARSVAASEEFAEDLR